MNKNKYIYLIVISILLLSHICVMSVWIITIKSDIAVDTITKESFNKINFKKNLAHKPKKNQIINY